MALVIDDPKLDERIHTVAGVLGKSVEETIWIALDRMDALPMRSIRPAGNKTINWDEVHQILDRVDRTPILDGRTPDEIIGYNEHGHFG